MEMMDGEKKKKRKKEKKDSKHKKTFTFNVVDEAGEH
jgi:hypothetical protein